MHFRYSVTLGLFRRHSARTRLSRQFCLSLAQTVQVSHQLPKNKTKQTKAQKTIAEDHYESGGGSGWGGGGGGAGRSPFNVVKWLIHTQCIPNIK